MLLLKMIVRDLQKYTFFDLLEFLFMFFKTFHHLSTFLIYKNKFFEIKSLIRLKKKRSYDFSEK